MSMPLVSREIIDSIRTQAIRRINDHSLYCLDVMSEITKENPNLSEAIKDTIGMICQDFDIKVNTPRGFALMLNIANLSVSIYQSIKQQTICDELEYTRID